MPGHARAVGEAFAAAGYDYLPDQNGEFRDGYFPITISNAYERRVSAAIGYLDPGTRLRENLTISTDTQVKELLVDGTRCVGVKDPRPGVPNPLLHAGRSAARAGGAESSLAFRPLRPAPLIPVS